MHLVIIVFSRYLTYLLFVYLHVPIIENSKSIVGRYICIFSSVQSIFIQSLKSIVKQTMEATAF